MNKFSKSPITSLKEAVKYQIHIDRYLVDNKIQNLVGNYGELLVQKALGGVMENAVNRGFDITHESYNRIEVKTRKYERRRDGIKKENRAVGFSGKENGFDWLAHVLLGVDYEVVSACIVNYSEVWPEIQKTTGKVGFHTSSQLPSSIDITEKLKQAEKDLLTSFQ